MSRLRKYGLYSMEVRNLGAVPFDSGTIGFSPTGPITGPAAPSGGAGIGTFPLDRLDRVISAADTAGGVALMHAENAVGSALHLLRDSLRRLAPLRFGVRTVTSVPGSTVKGLLDMTIAPGSAGEGRMNDAFVVIWPGMSVAQLRADLVGGVYYAGAHESGYKASPLPPVTNRTRAPTIDVQPPTFNQGGGGFLPSGGPPMGRRSPPPGARETTIDTTGPDTTTHPPDTSTSVVVGEGDAGAGSPVDLTLPGGWMKPLIAGALGLLGGLIVIRVLR